MAVVCSPFGPKPQFELSTGLPAIGGLLFFYVAGSVNTKQNTYTDSTGAVANTNPIVLNSLGMPPNEIWFTSGLAYKVVYAPVGDTDPPTSPIWTIDNLLGISTPTSLDQWVASGLTPTFVGATSFTFPGDQTSTFHIGRRLKTTISAGTGYHTILTSVFGALTTITTNGTALDAGLSAVSYGLLTVTNPSFPYSAANYYALSVSGTNTITGTVSGLGAYFAGLKITVVPVNTITGAATVNINGLGAKNIFAWGAACIGGELVTGTPALLEYDGVQFNVINPNPAVISFNPVLQFGGASTGITYTVQVGFAHRTKSKLEFWINIELSSSGSATGDATIAALPYASVNTTSRFSAVSIRATGLATISGHLQGSIGPNSTSIALSYLGTGTVANLTEANVSSAATFRIHGSYGV